MPLAAPRADDMVKEILDEAPARTLPPCSAGGEAIPIAAMAPTADRDTILRRRAHFVGTALLALSGCAGQPREPAAHPQSAVSVPPIDDDADSDDSAPPPATRASADWERDLPSLDVPADAEGVARQMFEQLAKRVPKAHESLAKLEAALPLDCRSDDKECEARWTPVLEELPNAKSQIKDLVPLCPGSSEQARRYSARVRAHVDFLNRRVKALESQIDEHMAKNDLLAMRKRIDGLTERVFAMTCLSCMDW